jgi:oligopeptidase B
MSAPLASRRPVTTELHGESWVDEYRWLRDRDDPEVVPYLEAENAFTEESTSRLETLREAIFNETRARVQETDLSAPARRGEWWYGRRTEEGKQYPQFLRWHLTTDQDPQVILDQNDLADHRSFCDLGLLMVSFDQTRLAYSVDHSGNETFALRFRDLNTGRDLDEEVAGTHYGGAWSADGTRFFYTTLDGAHRPYRIWQHVLGQDQAQDTLIFQEDDERFEVELGLTRDRLFIMIEAISSTTSETRVVPSESPDRTPSVLLPRNPGVRYRAEHHRSQWLVVTDEGAPNGRLISFEPGAVSEASELIPHDPLTKVGRVLPFARHLVVTGRRHGNPAISVIPDEGELFDIDFEEPAYRLGAGENLDYDTATFRFTYESFLAPRRVIDLDLDTRAQTIVKETPTPNYDASQYEQRRIWASVDDVELPITLVHRKGLALPAPTLLYGYGAYESSLDPLFDPCQFPLLDRGVVFAVAHIRGGGEMGRLWHEQGRMGNKVNTFRDFIAAAEFLLEKGVAREGQIAARGISAGGLLMGAVTTMRPELWAAVVAEVPFVDALNTMLDPSIPLTVGEWEEWGNPAIADQYQWMKEYSPYEHTVPADYPAILATAGFNDPRVAYWEPAKWVARLRTVNKGNRPILLKTEMGAGHGGPSGRYDAWRDEAFILAFVLDQLGVGKV